jgi:hypothetical protein
MLVGLSTRRYAAGLEPVGEQVDSWATGTSKSAVSRRFVAATAERLAELLARRLDDRRWLVVYLDGFGMGEHLLIGALGVTADGTKVPLGVAEGSSENAAVATRLVADLADRGLDAGQHREGGLRAQPARVRPELISTCAAVTGPTPGWASSTGAVARTSVRSSASSSLASSLESVRQRPSRRACAGAGGRKCLRAAVAHGGTPSNVRSACFKSLETSPDMPALPITAICGPLRDAAMRGNSILATQPFYMPKDEAPRVTAAVLCERLAAHDRSARWGLVALGWSASGTLQHRKLPPPDGSGSQPVTGS